MAVLDLDPRGLQKSFYGKAKVHYTFDGREVLYSYGTPIIERYPNGGMVRLWDGWSRTTGKHIKAFCGLDKKGFDSLIYGIS